MARVRSPTFSNLRIQTPPGVPPTHTPRQVNGTDNGLPDSGETVRPRKTGKMEKPVTVLVFVSEPRSLQKCQFNHKKGQPFQTMSHKILATKKQKQNKNNKIKLTQTARGVSPGPERLTTSPAGAAVLILTSELSSSQTHQNLNFPLEIVLHGIELANLAWHSV